MHARKHPSMMSSTRGGSHEALEYYSHRPLVLDRCFKSINRQQGGNLTPHLGIGLSSFIQVTMGESLKVNKTSHELGSSGLGHLLKHFSCFPRGMF